MHDFENRIWKLDIISYERAVGIVAKLDSIGNNSNRQFWVDRANEIADKYPSAKLVKLA